MQNTSRDYVNSLPLVLPLPSQREQTIVKSEKINEMGENIGKVKYSCQPIGVNFFHHDIPLTGQEATIAFSFDSSPVPVPPSFISCSLTPPDNSQLIQCSMNKTRQSGQYNVPI